MHPHPIASLPAGEAPEAGDSLILSAGLGGARFSFHPRPTGSAFMTAATAKKAPCRGGSDGSEINYALLGGKSARTQDIAQAIIAGEKNSVIAARFGVSRAHVSQVARRNGLPSKSRGSTLIDGQLFLLGRRILFDGNLKDEILCVNWYFAGGYVGSAKYGLMHRWIFGANTGCKVDHINGDTFDNRSANLRRITAQGSVRNRRRFSNAPTIFKGVRRTGNGWEAVINVDDQRVRLGFYAKRN